ncbi:MAG: hypothetical protein ACFE89_08300 [Candidatus Hodarchaeota archaeon]
MGQSKPVSGMLSTLLFLLYPLIGELLFLDTIIKDVYARQRIRIIFALVGLGVVAIWFSASELLILQAGLLNPSASLAIPIEIRYSLVAFVVLLFLGLLIYEGWGGQVSLEEQIEIPEDRISIQLKDPKEIFTTLNRILQAAQYRRWQSPHSDNSRLAKYALTLLGEYLQTRIFSEVSSED